MTFARRQSLDAARSGRQAAARTDEVMTGWDWLVILLLLGVVLGVGGGMARRGGRSLADFFVSGRQLPWWLAGSSILASGFACDTPLHIARVIREQGLSGAWFYWAALLCSPLVPFLFSHLWRRAGVLTDCEFIELRYTGQAAAMLRLVMALVRLGLVEALTLAWILLGMAKILRTVLQLPPVIEPFPGLVLPANVAVAVALMAVAVGYTALAGLWGVVANDLLQLVFSLGGGICVALVAMHRVGGPAGLRASLGHSDVLGGTALSFLPAQATAGRPGLGLGSFLVYCLLLGWSHEGADGGGAKAQRFSACRSEGHALAASIGEILVGNIVRAWPFYLAALASLVLLPRLGDPELAYPQLVIELLPTGARGLVIGSLVLAFLTATSTHLNLAASYAIHDLYRRFVRPAQPDRHYVRASRLAVVLLAALAVVVALQLTSVLAAIKLKAELMAGFGLVLLLRWYWPRISAWSEIAALLSSLVTASLIRLTGLGVEPVARLLGIDPRTGDVFPARMLLVVLVSALVTIAVTLLVRPQETPELRRFWARLHPPGKEVRAVVIVARWLCAASLLVCGVLGLGKLLLGFPASGISLLACALGLGWTLRRLLGISPLPQPSGEPLGTSPQEAA